MREEKTKRKARKKFSLSFNSYFRLVISTVLNPSKFAKQTPRFLRYKKPLFYLFINVQLGLLLMGGVNVFNSKDSDIFSPKLVMFPTLSEIIFLTPFIMAAFLGGIFILHLIAKFMGGKGEFRETLKSAGWLSAPLIFIWLPNLQLPALLLQIYLLIEGFGFIHLYPKRMAMVNILMPIFLVYLLMSMVV